MAATGDENKIPTSFSAIALDTDHVVCETVKEEEHGEGTIIRLYECKNIRGNVGVTLGIGAKKAYLCDLMENALCELPISDGKLSLPIKGFEILTVKVE